MHALSAACGVQRIPGKRVWFHITGDEAIHGVARWPASPRRRSVPSRITNWLLALPALVLAA
ncbi:hypothetical protein NGB36_04950 [Streptomyces sp. RB6PN25]|uniref:Uncharacterized protein n=1 Tax=Streptomyces humicola TaxID=2953240 RepID=A0ABT1PQK5_9ACTN|nr:hypothetical protein [Streptomyces humicola]MCQ4079954.1 hypothetical protein [Streptomyces humicola]